MYLKDVIFWKHESISIVRFLILCTKFSLKQTALFMVNGQFCCSCYSAGGTQIQPFISAGLINFVFNNNVTLVHNTNIY